MLDPSRAGQVSDQRVCFRLGERILMLDTDFPPVLEGLRDLYGECEVSPLAVSAEQAIHCSVLQVECLPVVVVRFVGPAPNDPVRLARSLLNGTREPLCVEVEAPVTGGRMLQNRERSHTLVLARGPDVLIDVSREPTGYVDRYGFLVHYLVSAVQSLQPDVVLVHAGSVGIRGRGVLLIGKSGAGKTTLSTALAARGHDFLGDEIGAIHISRRELLPFRQTARIRTGPRARVVDERLAASRLCTVPGDEDRVLARVGELFPAAAPRSLPLRATFVLRGFAERPAAERVQPRRDDLEMLKTMCSTMMVLATWGESAGHRLLKFLSVVDVLAHARCYALDSGSPDATADLVERIGEESWG